MGIAAGFCLERASCVHRFLISGPDLRIDARFSPIKHSSVHRFLISGPDFGIDAALSSLCVRAARLQHYSRCGKEEWFRLQHYRRCGKEDWFRLQHYRRCSKEEWFRLQYYRRCCKEEWFRLQHHRCCTEERPAFRMTVADAACPAATTFALRFHLSPPQRHSASGSIFLRRNDIRAPVPSFSAATKTVLRPEPTKTKKGWPARSPLLYKGIRLIC